MTDVAVPGNQGVEAYDPNLMVGMDDVDMKDLITPTLRIDHKKNRLVDSLTNNEYESMEIIVLGVVKGRVLWPAVIQGGEPEPPLCKSLDFENGMPNISNGGIKFPWLASGFSALDYQQQILAEMEVILKCADCKLKDWGSFPNSPKPKPWCQEQWKFPILVKAGDEWTPSVISFSSTALTPVKSYVTSFFRSKTPMFVSYTKISLDPQVRGSVEWSLPVFTRGGDTDREKYNDYAKAYRQLREFLTTNFVSDREPEIVAAPVQQAPVQQNPINVSAIQVPTPAQPVQQAPVQQQPQAQPVQQQPTVQAQPVQQQPQPAPVVESRPLQADASPNTVEDGNEEFPF